MNEAALRAYLLGKLGQSEIELVENRLVEDPDLFSQLQVAEDDLFDAYARGELDANESARFVERFGGDLDRRRFANAFVQRTKASARVLPFPRRYWMPIAAAATLLAGVYVFPWNTPIREVSPVVNQPARAQAPAAPATMRIPLALGSSRSTSGAVRVAIDPAATQADLAIRVNPADRYALYAVELRSQEGLIIWGDATLRSTSENGDVIVHAIVPAERLAAGSYELSVRGGATASTLDDLGFLTIEVKRGS